MGLIRFRNRTKINLTGLTSSSPGVKVLKQKKLSITKWRYNLDL